MSTFNYFQIGDFCKRTFAGLLSYPIQQRQTSFIDLLVNSPLSQNFQSIVQNGYDKRRYTLSYAQKACGGEVAADICEYEGAGYTPAVKQIEYSFDGAPKVATRVIKIGSQTYQQWCDMNGGGEGYIQLLQQQLASEIAQAYERLERDLLQQAYNNKGCYADGTNAAKQLQLFLNATSGAPSVNPAWAFSIEQGLVDLGLSDQSFYVGGGQFWQAQRVLQAGYQVPNTMLGVASQTTPNNFAYSSQANKITTATAFEKVFVISPEAVAFTTFSKVANQFANIPINPNSDVIQSLWGASFANTAREQAFAFVITDPVKGLLWDVFAVLEQCGADYELRFQAQLTYQFHVLPIADRICDNPCFSGIQIYDLCPLPVAEPCEAPEPIVPSEQLCLTATLPEPCTIAIPSGTTLTFTIEGGEGVDDFVVTYLTPISYTIETEADFFLLLSSMFGSNPGSGNWYYGECGLTYNGNGGLFEGVGELISVGNECVEIALSVDVCDC